MEKIVNDEKIIEELKKRIETYNLEDKDTEEEIIEKILASEDFKKFSEFENPEDDTNNFVKKSLSVEHFRNKKMNKN